MHTGSANEGDATAAPLELMRLHMEALFTHDALGRMVRVNEQGGGPAPRFFLGRTVAGVAWRVRADVDENTILALRETIADERVGAVTLVEPHRADRYHEILSRSAAVESTWTGPAYHFPKDLPATPDCVAIDAENLELIRLRFSDWIGDVVPRQPFVALVQNGFAAAVCCSARKTPKAHEGGVETHPDFRQRGFGANVVAAWARAVRQLGALPLYSTSWQNRPSQAVARRLGLTRFGVDLHIT